MSEEHRLDRSVLEAKKADELRAIAKTVGVQLSGRPTKSGVIEQILQFTGVAVSDSTSSSKNGAAADTATEERPKRSRPSRAKSAAAADASADASSNGSGSVAVATAESPTAPAPSSDAPSTNGSGSSNGSSPEGKSEGKAEAKSEGKAEGKSEGKSDEQGERSGRNRDRQRGFDNYAAEGGSGNSRSSRRRRGRNRDRDRDRGDRGDRSERQEFNEQPYQGEPVACEGYLELRDEGFGFLRGKTFLNGAKDVYVPVSQVRKYLLRKGDYIEGQSRPPTSTEKFPALLSVDKISGLAPDVARERPRFEDLTPLFPDAKLHLEVPGDSANMTARIVDLLAPIGRGQRGLIVSPPKAGKTTVMKQIAHSIEANNPNVHLMVLLVDERPEEVTDMRRTVRGEVIASTFDRPADEHTRVSELALERAKRLVEQGTDVVIILDGITRLARAYNLAAPASGRILSGGVDSGALYPPKKFFGSARNIEEGGSLTILATALVETGSKMDEVIFEEFKGTGNMELRLDRRLAERRLYPAIDVNASSTRHEELLFDRTELTQVWKLRRVLNALGQDGSPAAGLELLMDKIKTTKSNEEFLAEIAKNQVPGA